MKISIKWDDTKLTLRFPTSLVLNRLTAGIVRKQLKKEGIHLTRKQTVLFIKELKRYKKTHRDWNLVEVEGSDEDSVIVKI
jgi:replication-associated recombination protein RarA